MKPAHPVDLVAVLAARDERAARQAELAGRWAKPLASMTLVSPGPVKDSARHRYLMDLAFVRLERKLAAAGIEVLERRRGDSPAGPEALLAVACDASRLKSIALELEEGRPWGRLLDIDVLTPWEILRREDLGKAPRSCLCCDRPALECMRERRHPVDVLVAEAERLMPFAEIGMTEDAAAAAIGEMAVDALSLEAALEDKPGLVRPGNRGAHDDMDYPMLLCSAEALRECFTECAEAGLRFGRQGGPEARSREIRVRSLKDCGICCLS